jgi:hypothetical protein
MQSVLTTHQRKSMLFPFIILRLAEMSFLCENECVLSFIILKIAICVRVDSFCCLLSKNEINN